MNIPNLTSNIIKIHPQFRANKRNNTTYKNSSTVQNGAPVRISSYKSSKRTSLVANGDIFELQSKKPHLNYEGETLPIEYQTLLDSYPDINQSRRKFVQALMLNDIASKNSFSSCENCYVMFLDDSFFSDDSFFDKLNDFGLITPETTASVRRLIMLNDEDWEKIKNSDTDLVLKITDKLGVGDLTEFLYGEISKDEIYERLAKGNLEQTLSGLSFGILDNTMNNIQKAFYNGSAQASNYEMLLQLIDEGKLPVNLAATGFKDVGFNKNALSDIDLLFNSYAEGQNPKDVFVPEFESHKEAFNSLKTGDVYHLKGKRNIFIITNPERKKELGLTKETYLELFPPVERFAYTQQEQGNCWFISTLDALYSNPKTRYEILKCFRENEDGTLDVCLGGYTTFNGKSVKNNLNSFEFLDASKTLLPALEKNRGYFSGTCEGLRLIEEAYEIEQETKALKNIRRQYAKFKHLEANGLKAYNEIDGFNYSKEEIEEFLELAEKCLDDPKLASETFVDTSIKQVYFSHSFIEEKLAELSSNKAKEKYSENDIQRMKRILTRYKNYYEKNECNESISIGAIPLDVYNNIVPSDAERISSKNPYSDGGNQILALRAFDFYPSVHSFNNDFGGCSFIAELSLEENVSNTVLLAATSNKSNNDIGIRQNHAYSVQIARDEKTSELRFIIKDPMNTLFEKELTYKEFLDNFTYAAIAHPKYN